MAETIQLTKYSTEEKLPALNTPVLTETRERQRYVAMRVESTVKKGDYIWVLVHRKLGVGQIYDVAFWFEN